MDSVIAVGACHQYASQVQEVVNNSENCKAGTPLRT